MKAKLLYKYFAMTKGKEYEVLDRDDEGFHVMDDEFTRQVIPVSFFEVVPDEPSAAPAATTNVVIDGPGEYVRRDGRMANITRLRTQDELNAPNNCPEHIWLSDTGRCWKPDGTYGTEETPIPEMDIVRKVVRPIPAWDPMTPGPDLVGVKFPDTKPSNPKDVIGSTKPPLSCIPTGPLYEVGAAMLDGSAKYGRHNWRVIGVRSSVYYDAALRHLMKWWEGEELDTDSGCHHLAHAVACCLIVRDAANLGQLTDDRPVPGGDPTAGVKELIKQIKERYPEPVPPFLASQK